MRDERGKLIKKEDFERLYVSRSILETVYQKFLSQVQAGKIEHRRATDWRLRAFIFASAAVMELIILWAVTHG